MVQTNRNKYTRSNGECRQALAIYGYVDADRAVPNSQYPSRCAEEKRPANSPLSPHSQTAGFVVGTPKAKDQAPCL